MTQEIGQNWFASVALVSWPLIALLFYRLMPASQATIWTVLGSYLLLPAQASVKIAEGVPQLDKASITAIAALLGSFLFGKHRRVLPGRLSLADGLWLLLLLSPFITSLLNDNVVAGSVLLPPLGIYDGLSSIVAQFLFAAPFIIGRRLLRSLKDVEAIFRALVVAALAYSIPIVFELRMSPQLNRWVYGFYPFQFNELMRSGGYRPAVFIGHGLAVSFFLMTAIIASTAFWRARVRLFNFHNSIVQVYLSALLVLCKSLGPDIYALFAACLVWFLKPRLQARIALILTIFAVAYPLLRSLDLVPADQIVRLASTINEDRAASLQFRFDNEKQLLERAMLRPVFGWGRWGRSRVYDESGKDISITDGRWVITLGQFGLVGFFAEFGLFLFSVFQATSALRLIKDDKSRVLFAAFTLMMGINIFDLLPNAELTPWTWLLVGSLLGVSEEIKASVRQLKAVPNIAVNSLLGAK